MATNELMDFMIPVTSDGGGQDEVTTNATGRNVKDDEKRIVMIR